MRKPSSWRRASWRWRNAWRDGSRKLLSKSRGQVPKGPAPAAVQNAAGSSPGHRVDALIGVGIDLIRFACPIVGSALVWHLLQILDLLAHGLAAAAIGLALSAAGLVTRNRRLLRVGLAVLLAAAIAGLAANGLKLVFRVPRPHTPGSFSFPSGHAATAAAVAAVLVRAFPPAGPLFVFVALF